MGKTSIYILIIVAAMVIWLGVWINQPGSNVPVGGTSVGSIVAGSDTTSAINHELNAITVEDPDFKNIDSDLNSL